jgi:hypothetical protein
MVRARALPPRSLSLRARVSKYTPALAHMLDSLVRVSRRGKGKHFDRARERTRRPSLGPDRDEDWEFQMRAPYLLPELIPRPQNPPCPARGGSTAARGRPAIPPHSSTASLRFPFSNFKHYLTLFPKFFSSFPHGTCSLSVSRQYLALDGIYHPL